MGSKMEVLERREKVLRFKLAGLTIPEISRIAEISPRQVDRDLLAIRVEGSRYFLDDAKARQRRAELIFMELSRLEELWREARIEYAKEELRGEVKVQWMAQLIKIAAGMRDVLSLGGMRIRDLEYAQKVSQLEAILEELKVAGNIKPTSG